MKTIYYYQTFVGLDKMLTHIQDIDVIIVSSIHFGKNSDKIPGIYLNDNEPDNIIFNKLWLQTEKASSEGCRPSEATRLGSAIPLLVMSVMFTKRTPLCSEIALA